MSNQMMMVFEELRRNHFLCDAVLQVEGTQFQVHKLVLCNCSPYFKSLFANWSTPDDNIFDIPNLSADVMRVFIEFAYTGVVTITADNIGHLFTAADRFDVTGITQACCEVMLESLSPNTCLNTLFVANNFYYPELRKRVFSYVLKHFEEVVRCPDFVQLSVEDLVQIIKHDLLNVHQESAVFEAILLWINHSHHYRKRHIPHLLPNVRLALMDSQYFSSHVFRNEMVRRNRKCNTYLIRTMKLILDVGNESMPISLFPDLLARPRVPRAVLMAVGGWNIVHPTNRIEAFDNRSKQWVPVINSDKTPRAYHGTVFLNGSVYIMGGFDGMEQFCTMHKYNLVNRTWQEVAPMHTNRCYVSVTTLHGCIYAMGGFDGIDRLDTAERYTPKTNQWTMIAPMNEQRSDANSSTMNEKIYICGGFNGVECLPTAESYNSLTDQWTMIANMSTRRSGVSIIAYAGEIYAVGGFTGLARLKTVEAYNPETNRWRPLPSMLNPRSNFGIAVLDEQLYAVGGFNGFTTITCAERFDVRTGVWSDICNIDISRSALSCCVVHDLPNMTDYCSPRAALAESEEEVDIPPVE
uniref:Kelch like family member 10 n=1 Tax=Neogobius melanostomus TaxID=47308 RepID=A0A8C6WJN8_9GOBI